MPKPTKQPLTNFVPDPNNANAGTQRGRGMLENSLRECGTGRSILVDKNGVTIAGAKTLETAVESGFENAIVVDSTGQDLIVVRRTDLDMGEEKAQKLAVLDNRVGEVDLKWDPEALQSLEFDASEFWFEDEWQRLFEEKKVGRSEEDSGEDEAGGIGSGEIHCQCPECGHEFIKARG